MVEGKPMKRSITRSYIFSEGDVREALLAWLRAKDLPTPKYIGNTPDTDWAVYDDGGIRVEWTEEDEVEQ
jgi:hypothetical protein